MISGHVLRTFGASAMIAAAGAAFAPAAASARVIVGLGIGLPFVAPAPIYYPPPVYYLPPPPPVYYAPAPAPAAAVAPAAECRDFSTTNVIDGRPQEVHGTACRQPDGSWRIVD